MRVALVFLDWKDPGFMSIYNTKAAVDLSMGVFHGGSRFEAEIALDAEDADDLRVGIEKGFRPVFYAAPLRPKAKTEGE